MGTSGRGIRAVYRVNNWVKRVAVARWVAVRVMAVTMFRSVGHAATYLDRAQSPRV